MPRKIKLMLIMISISIIALLVYMKFEPYFSKNYNSTSGIIKSYITKIKSTKNMHAAGNIDISISSEDMSMPVKLSFDMKTNVKDKAYMENTLNMSFFGMPVNTTTKTYTCKEDNKTITYTYQDETEKWTYEETEAESKDNTLMDLSKLNDYEKYIDNLDKNTEFNKTKEGYEVKIDLEKIDTKTLNKIIEDNNKKQNDTDNDTSMLKSMVTSDIGKIEGNMTAKFNKEGYLTEIEISNCKMKTSSGEKEDEDGISMDATLEINSKIEISDYNKLDEKEYTVSEDIKNNAVKENETDYTIITDDTEESNKGIVDEWGNTVDEESGDFEEPSVALPTDNLYGQNGYYIVFGSSIVKLPTSYKTLKDDDWNINLSDYDIDENYELEPNDRINGNLEIYNEKYDGPVLIGFENRTDKTSKILNSDIWSIDISYTGENSVPISVNGLSWSSTENDVLKILGKSNYIEEYSDGTIYKYIIDDDDLNDILEIYITNNRINRVKLTRE